MILVKSSLNLAVRFNLRKVRFTSHLSDSSLIDIYVCCNYGQQHFLTITTPLGTIFYVQFSTELVME